ncbi:MAG TPA: hypothetical protein VL307_01360 [Chitinophagaceae bacterium]|nr:hypothetical protein [Chitinophagaceae bacterium]
MATQIFSKSKSQNSKVKSQKSFAWLVSRGGRKGAAVFSPQQLNTLPALLALRDKITRHRLFSSFLLLDLKLLFLLPPLIHATMGKKSLVMTE